METIINVDNSKTLKKVLVCSPKFFKPTVPINSTEEETFKKEISVSKLVHEHDNFVNKLQSLGVEVLELLAQNNMPQQTFVRDLGFTINEKFYFGKSIEEMRQGEVQVAQKFLNCKNSYNFKDYLEGGDIVVFKNNVFVGISNRTTAAAVEELQALLKDNFKIIPLKLKEKILHLDTVFNVVGDIIVINSQGIETEFDPLKYTNKVVHVNTDEQFYLPTNFLPISDNLIIANTMCKATNESLRKLGVIVEEVSFKELVKLGGAFRCCSMELIKM